MISVALATVGVAVSSALSQDPVSGLMLAARDAVFSDLRDGLFVLDADDRIVDLNRTAERIVVELREKVADALGGGGEEIVVTRVDDPRRLARDGLVELGFTVPEADELLRDAADGTPEALIAQALRSARSSLS